jgi:hypothetical protein
MDGGLMAAGQPLRSAGAEAELAVPVSVALIGGTAGQPAALVATSAAGRSIDMRLPVLPIGIGARYLAAVASSAAAAGWHVDELRALVSEIDRRTVQWVAASSTSALLPGRRRWPRRAAKLVAGRWTETVCAADEGDRLVKSAGRRNAVCLVAISGTGHPRWVATAFTRWRAAGARGGRVGEALESASIGARWAVDVVVAPRVPARDLPGLREQLAAAPRCGWCHLPVLGVACERCSPEWDA